MIPRTACLHRFVCAFLVLWGTSVEAWGEVAAEEPRAVPTPTVPTPTVEEGTGAKPLGFRDTWSDTWVAVDALGRSLPTHAEVGDPRPNRDVAMFYFLWLGAHTVGGPWDITKILARDPDAMAKKDSPLWGPLHAPHHWGESLFGYYQSEDPWVLRKHARMLSDAGVDAVIFDVTNQVTYRDTYRALLREFAAVARDGGKPPRVAFLCPFWDPARVVRELYRDLYEPGFHRELWYTWEGKPLILADPEKLDAFESHEAQDGPTRLEAGHTLAQSFRAEKAFDAAGGRFPTWSSRGSSATLALRRGGPGGEVLATRRIADIDDNAWCLVSTPEPQPPGEYTLELSEPKGTVGWWSHQGDVFPRGEAFADGRAVAGDRTLRIRHPGDESTGIRGFFTFRTPQPDYFRGPTGPDQWSWLEVAPQHIFRNSKGEAEQMSVGVGQNAVGNRLGSMSEAGARGRSFHAGGEDTSPDSVRRGLNFAEQFERALAVDPRVIFITGWNEWFAGRFDEFSGVRLPVMFVDEFDQEHSRDIEPMRGGHGDDYYHQMIAFIRRYKGVRALPRPSAPATISVERAGGFAAWAAVAPEYRDALGDTFHRDHTGYNGYARLVNVSGRNDIALAKVARDSGRVYFLAETREALTPSTDPRWMWLLIDSDRDASTGWEGYDLIANRRIVRPGVSLLERNVGGWRWEPVGEIPFAVEGSRLHLALPRDVFGAASAKATLAFDFKWVDNAPESGDILDFHSEGDAAPDGRFRYRFSEEGGK